MTTFMSINICYKYIMIKQNQNMHDPHKTKEPSKKSSSVMRYPLPPMPQNLVPTLHIPSLHGNPPMKESSHIYSKLKETLSFPYLFFFLFHEYPIKLLLLFYYFLLLHPNLFIYLQLLEASWFPAIVSAYTLTSEDPL